MTECVNWYQTRVLQVRLGRKGSKMVEANTGTMGV